MEMQRMRRRNSSTIFSPKRINSKKEIIGHRLSDVFIQQLECIECYCHVDNFNQIERIAEWIEEENRNENG